MTSTFLLNKRLVNIKGVTAHKNKKKTKADFQETFEKVNPDIIVNCVGYTDVDGCESDPNKSYNSNVGFASLVAKRPPNKVKNSSISLQITFLMALNHFLQNNVCQIH